VIAQRADLMVRPMELAFPPAADGR
jgi:hypothetical protein